VPQVAMVQQAPMQSSNKAIASLVCGVLFLCAPASIAAIILGHLALVDIKRSANRMTGHGLAIAGLVMGYLGIALTIIYIVLMVFMFRTTLSRDVPANETAAIATMRTYNQALKAYAAKCPQQGYPATLLPLGPGPGNCAHANLTDARLAVPVPVRRGYMFQYTPGASDSQQIRVFALVARPVQPSLTGKRFFFLDEEGVIRQADSQIIGPRSDPVDAVDAPASEQDQDKGEN
jgi:type II secretory pathway pseudopilin PulG